MGREASGECRWGKHVGHVKALLESNELIVRGAFRASISRSDIRDVRAAGSMLTFTAHDDPVEIHLSPAVATAWARALLTPPPTLARKLGIAPETRIMMYGQPSGAEIVEAMAVGTTVRSEPDLILVFAEGETEVAAFLKSRVTIRARPVWIVYRKGPKNPFGETAVRALMREHRFIDTKVASVSAELTALRFSARI